MEQRNGNGNGDPQFTTRGAGEQLDETVAAAGGPIAGPGEGQGGTPKKASPPARRPRRKSVAARRGADETGRKTGTGEKIKNPRQLRNPRRRKERQMGPTGRRRAGVGRKPKGKSRTAAGQRRQGAGGSPKAKRRKANRGRA
ncbi:MAG: hypothetical protein ACJ79H_20765 [Myxococcales bacterium]